jgi:hypothetical protein
MVWIIVGPKGGDDRDLRGKGDRTHFLLNAIGAGGKARAVPTGWVGTAS